MHKERGRAGAGQGGGQFTAHMPAFAHAGDDHAAFGIQHQVAGSGKAGVQAVFQASTARASISSTRWPTLMWS